MQIIVLIIILTHARLATASNRTTDQQDDCNAVQRAREKGPAADQMFVDLRQDRCLSAVRNQGPCGSCYAFAGISLAEWAYCKQMNNLRAFSEQYVLDCAHLVGIEKGGCKGGELGALNDFFHTLGFELRDQYLAYRARAAKCAVSGQSAGDGRNLSNTGFVRTKIKQFVAVPIERWHEVLASESPLFVPINLPADFQNYTSGVYSGIQFGSANETLPHSMVLVGHGREGGQEFWLLKNSHGIEWGERGYLKLAKSVAKLCVLDQRGYAYGARNERQFSINWRPNRVNWSNFVAALSGRVAKGPD